MSRKDTLLRDKVGKPFCLDDCLDLTVMEKELTSLIKEEEKYKRENDAKFRAVAQNVPTYEDFRDIVKASHLKPLETCDKTELRANKIWNTMKSNSECRVANNRKITNRCFVGSHSLDGEQLKLEKELWNIKVAKERYMYLQKLEKEKLNVFVSSALCPSCIGLVFTSLTEMEENIDDFNFVLDVLEQLTRSAHFSRSLSLLSGEDKAACRKVLHVLRSIVSLHANTETAIDNVKYNSLIQRFGDVIDL